MTYPTYLMMNTDDLQTKGNEIPEALALPFHPDTPTFLSWTIKTVTPSSELSSTESDYGKKQMNRDETQFFIKLAQLQLGLPA